MTPPEMLARARRLMRPFLDIGLNLQVRRRNMHLSDEYERLLKGLDTCRLVTVDTNGYPHCVPVGYVYHNGRLYIPTVSGTKAHNRKLPQRDLLMDPSHLATGVN